MFGSGSSTTPYLRRTFAHDQSIHSLRERGGKGERRGEEPLAYSTSRGFLANPLVALSRRETCIPYGLYVCMCRASSLASVGVCARCRRHGQKEHGWQAGMDGSAAWPSASAPPYPVYPSRGKKKKSTSLRGPRHRQTGERRPSTRQTPYPPRLFRGHGPNSKTGL